MKNKETFWEIQAKESQHKSKEKWTDIWLEDIKIDGVNSKILILGGTGGLGSRLKEIFNCHCVGSIETNVLSIDALNLTLEKYNPNVVINMAAINIDGLIHKQSDTSVNKMIEINVLGATNVLRTTIEWWRANNISGRYIYLSSILSSKPIKGTGLYSASKAYNDNLIKTAALENSRAGITVNSIQLGYFEGGLTEKIPSDFLSQIIHKLPINRLGKSKDLKEAINFLIQSSYITGTILEVSGGLQLC